MTDTILAFGLLLFLFSLAIFGGKPKKASKSHELCVCKPQETKGLM